MGGGDYVFCEIYSKYSYSLQNGNYVMTIDSSPGVYDISVTKRIAKMRKTSACYITLSFCTDKPFVNKGFCEARNPLQATLSGSVINHFTVFHTRLHLSRLVLFAIDGTLQMKIEYTILKLNA